MKKVILVLFSLMFSVTVFSQAEAYGTTAFKHISIIETDDWAMTNNRCFQVNDTTYILAYEPLKIPKAGGNSYNADVKDKNIYLYRYDSGGWKKASGLIRHDYFYAHFVKGGSFTADSLRALDVHVRQDDKQSYGTIKIDSKKGIVTIEIKSLVYIHGRDLQIRNEFDDLILTPKGNGMYNFVIKPTAKK